MLSLILAPPLLSLTGNPVQFNIQSDNSYEMTGAKPSFTLVFTSTGSTGNAFTLTWGSNSVSFTCAGSPDNSGNQIPDGTVESDLNSYVAIIAPYIALNYFIARDFTVYAEGNLIKFISRNFGSEYHLVVESNWSLSGYNSGVEPVLRPFYKIGLQLFLKINGVWQQIAEDLLPVDSTGSATFDIHTLFADHLVTEFAYPESATDLLIHREKSCREYRVRYFEQFGNPITPSILFQSESFYVLHGGISQLQERIDSRKETSFWEKLTYNKKFLSTAPDGQLVDRNSIIKLYHLVQSAIPELVLKVEVNYNNGTPQAILTKASISSPQNKSVFECCVGPATLQLPGYASGTIDNYRVWLENGSGSRISEIRTFVMDHTYHEYVRQFLYLGSQGGMETLGVTGLQEDNLDYERIFANKAVNPMATEQDHQYAQLSVTEKQIHKVNTGWLSLEALTAVRDLLVSLQVYLVDNGRLIPVVIITSQLLHRKDGEDLYAIDFEYRRSFESSLYTRDIPSGSFNDDYNTDYEIE